MVVLYIFIYLIFFVFELKYIRACSKLGSNTQCSGCPPTFNGLPCASTTRYEGSGSACGCFDNWAMSGYTAAPSESFWVRNLKSGLTWCGRRCGECYELTTTGGWINGMGPNPVSDVSITVMIVDVCPNAGNEFWCGQGKDPISCERDKDCETYQNNAGFLAHFDLHNDNGQINPGLNWDNVEVTYKRVNCPTPTNWDTCECEGQTQPFAFNEWRYDPNNDTTNDDDDGKNNTALIIGITVPSSIIFLLGIFIIIIIIFILSFKKKGKKEQLFEFNNNKVKDTTPRYGRKKYTSPKRKPRV